jgi:hypothetical protein
MASPGTFRVIVTLQHHGSNWLDRTSQTFDAIDPLLPSGVPRSIEFTISTLGPRHERRQRRAKQDGASRQLIHLKASIRLDVVFARDRPPQSHLLADELPKLFRAAQRERHLLGLIELLGDARFAQ